MKNMFSVITLVLLSGVASLAKSMPAEVLIIRHGEKISDAQSGLSPKGFQRADALVKLFTQDLRMLDFGKPVAIYAGSPKKSSGSIRPLQTIQPTAKALGLNPITEFESKDVDGLVRAITSDASYDGKTVLISWPHQEIPDIAVALGAKQKNAGQWDGAVFDRVWKLKFDHGTLSSFEDLPQRALPGDSQN